MFPVVFHEVGRIQQEGIGIEYLGGKNPPFPRMLADLHHQNDEKQHFLDPTALEGLNCQQEL